MTEVEFAGLVKDPKVRTARYRDLVRAYYDRVTDTYRSRWGESFHFAVFQGAEPLPEALLATERRIADEGGFRAGMKVLDVGCGIGGPALNIAEHSGAHVTGVNIVEHHIEVAKQRAAERGLADKTAFVLMDGMELEFPDNHFDAVYVFEAGCHMPDKPRFYHGCARVLKPGGVFVGMDWLRKDGLSPADEATYIEPICRHFSVPQLISLNELSQYLTDAGLTVEQVEDVTTWGNILRNWELVDSKIVQGLRRFVPWLIPPTERLLADGGTSLSKAARVGAFVIGHWRARKPLPGDAS